jgi:hypothetical protein
MHTGGHGVKGTTIIMDAKRASESTVGQPVKYAQTSREMRSIPILQSCSKNLVEKIGGVGLTRNVALLIWPEACEDHQTQAGERHQDAPSEQWGPSPATWSAPTSHEMKRMTVTDHGEIGVCAKDASFPACMKKALARRYVAMASLRDNNN